MSRDESIHMSSRRILELVRAHGFAREFDWKFYVFILANNVEGKSSCIQLSEKKVLLWPQFFTDLYQSFTASLYHQNIFIYSFIKNMVKIVTMATIFLQYIPGIYFCLFLTWKHEGKWMPYFHKTITKVQHHLCATF